ncbi:hypothetical protein ACFWPU_29630 [Streptomyces sp. NPDC058471]|uniref:hypothetical protein n=1 Tax=Streptomyces sp. NPDC058471 TaxID=3346516 RepID=UPI0036512748
MRTWVRGWDRDWGRASGSALLTAASSFAGVRVQSYGRHRPAPAEGADRRDGLRQLQGEGRPRGDRNVEHPVGGLVRETPLTARGRDQVEGYPQVTVGAVAYAECVGGQHVRPGHGRGMDAEHQDDAVDVDDESDRVERGKFPRQHGEPDRLHDADEHEAVEHRGLIAGVPEGEIPRPARRAAAAPPTAPGCAAPAPHGRRSAAPART